MADREWTIGDAWAVATSGVGVSAAHVHYQHDPIGWVRDKLLIPEHTLRWSMNGYLGHEWDGTVDPLVVLFEGVAAWEANGMGGGGGVSVESGTGTGKSYGLALLILWFLACFEDAEVYTFAPKEDQLRLYIWKNIAEVWPRFVALFPGAILTDLRIQMRGVGNDNWSAHGFPVAMRAGEQVSIRASGMHAQHMLLVYEEMPGIELPVTLAGKNTCTAPHNLRIGIGNPNHQLDALHRMSLEPGVIAVRMSALDHPNVVMRNPSIVPGAVSEVSIAKRLLEYGERSPVYQSRVRGVSPEQASDALIRLEWLKASAQRYAARLLYSSEHGPEHSVQGSYTYPGIPNRVTGKGVDAANSDHGDQAAICDFAGNVMVRIDAFACPDSNLLGAQAVREARTAGLAGERVGVDAIGVGAGTVNEARRQGFTLNALYAGGKPMVMVEKMADGKPLEWSPDVNKFENLRGQMYWQAREDLRLNVIDVPEDKELWEELVCPTFEDDNKVVKVEKKDDLKPRLGRSPNKADAFVMANWVRSRKLDAAFVQPLTKEDGKSLGFDEKKQAGRKGESAEDILQKWIGGARSVTFGRNAVPRR